MHRKLGSPARRISSPGNRDEKRTRGRAFAPAIRECGGVRYVAPVDSDFGGTWIAVNEFGVSVCLLNGDAGTQNAFPSPRRSRGLLLRELAWETTGADCLLSLKQLDLSPYAPFVLLILEPDRPAILAEWNRERLPWIRPPPRCRSPHLPSIRRGVRRFRLNEFARRAGPGGPRRSGSSIPISCESWPRVDAARTPILLACIARMRRPSASVGSWSRATRFDSCIRLPLHASVAHANKSYWRVPPDHRKFMGQFILIALATFVSEDLDLHCDGCANCLGQAGIPSRVLACVAGIFFGDLLLYFAGRLLGRPIVRWKPLRKILSEQKLDLASNWLAERGASVVILSRFTPGLRLPTYVAAGIAEDAFLDLLVLLPAGRGALDAVAGRRVSRARQEPAPSRLRGTCSRSGGSRSAPAANQLADATPGPGMGPAPDSMGILAALVGVSPGGALHPVPRHPAPITDAVYRGQSGHTFGRIRRGIEVGHPESPGSGARVYSASRRLSADARFRAVKEFLSVHGLSYPIVLKPDIGERGTGVVIAKRDGDVAAYFRTSIGDTIVQRYVAGLEFGVFYYRYPHESRGCYSLHHRQALSLGNRRWRQHDPRARVAG